MWTPSDDNAFTAVGKGRQRVQGMKEDIFGSKTVDQLPWQGKVLARENGNQDRVLGSLQGLLPLALVYKVRGDAAH